MQAYKKRGFWIGLAAFFAVLLSPNPESLSPIGWAVAAVTLLMAIWWATEAVPVAVTALLPLALFPLLQVTDFKTAALPYANPNIYLFMGGFILALGIESSGLHKRLALKMLIAIGDSGARLSWWLHACICIYKHVGHEHINHIDVASEWVWLYAQALLKPFQIFQSKRKRILRNIALCFLELPMLLRLEECPRWLGTAPNIIFRRVYTRNLWH